MKLFASGMTGKAIALQLGISRQTVDKHKDGVFKALNVDNRVSMVTAALKRRMIRIKDL